jgi:hypothetical protein
MNLRGFALCSFPFALLLLPSSPAWPEDLQPSKNAGPYVPSPQSVVADMLKVAGVGPDDFIIDLGSGDGRIVLTAAKVFGARGFGVEIKDDLVQKANQAAKAEGIADRVKFVKQDLFKTDISQATVLTMYLLPDTVNMLKQKLLTELRLGTRIISHDYPLTGWKAQDYRQFDLQEKIAISGVTTTLIYLYIVPAKVAGRWTATVPASVSRKPIVLHIRQQVTRISGSAVVDGREVLLDDAEIEGDRVRFKLLGRKEAFAGQVKGKAIKGSVDSDGRKAPWSATLGG